MKDICIIRAILPDIFEAKQIARGLISNKLAVSCHITLIDSVYHWEGTLVSEKETKLEIITAEGLFDKINEFIQHESSYELTDVLEMSSGVEAPQEIKNWVLQNTI